MRTLIDALDARFEKIDRRSRELIASVADDRLFWSAVPAEDTLILSSVGGSVLRSAAMVEQAFLGLTRRLWDDPFEWTLPERLSSKAAVIEYLDEVAATRRSGLLFLKSDEELSRKLTAPRELKTINDVLAEAITRAEEYLKRAETAA
jgi:hypothetical protein